MNSLILETSLSIFKMSFNSSQTNCNRVGGDGDFGDADNVLMYT